MQKFIQDNLRYPKEALTNRIEGVVEVSYVVDGQGRIKEAKVTKGIGHGCDEEALRIVKSLVFEKAYNRGLNTRTKKSLKIQFKLPVKKGLNLNYTVVQEPKKATPPPQGRTYNITIDIPQKK